MRLTKLVQAAAAVALTAGVAQAQAGLFDGTGSINATGNPGAGQPVTLTFVSPYLTAVPTLNGIFSGIPVGTNGTAQTITVGTGPYNVPNFMQIAGYTFSLTYVAPGTFGTAQCSLPAAPGQTCSPANTPFNFTNNSNGKGGINTSANFNFSGVVTTPTAQSYNYDGIFTSQFASVSYQELTAAIDAGQTVPVSYSLNVNATSAVPEPATVGLMATGLLALGGFVRRRRTEA